MEVCMNKRRLVLGHVLIAAACCLALFAVITGCDPSGEAVIEVKDDVGTVEDAGRVDFGSCEYGSEVVDKSFEIMNKGNNAVEIKGLSVTNVEGSDFELLTEINGTLESGGIKNFDIRFAPALAGSYSADVSIDLADTDNDFNFTVTGTGTDGSDSGGDTGEAPTDLTATTQSTTSIRLDWTDKSDNETGFRVERSPDGSSGWSEVTATAADVVSYDDTGLAAGTTYWYRVCATSGGGDTAFSNTADATTQSDVTDPTLSVANIFDGGGLETGFIVGTASDDVGVSSVEVSLDGGAYQTASGTTTWSFQLPTGTDVWKIGSDHTIVVLAKDASGNSSTVFSANVTKGVNKDTDGNGYLDLVVGASGYSDTGKIYLYDGTSSGLSASSSLYRLGSSGDAFGWAVAISDFDADGFADVAVGAPSYSSYTGRVRVFYGSASGIAASGTTLATGEATSNFFGVELAAGDFDNDGYADLAVGASGYSSDTGRVTIYHGGSSGLSSTPAQTLTGSSNSSFGKALATGDVDNDGYDDLAIGAPGYNPGSASGTGAVYVHHGSALGIEGAYTRMLEGETATDSFGVSVAVGNADGDSYDDLAVGAEGYGTSNGRAYVYHGASGGIGSTASRTLDGGSSGDFFGVTVGFGNFNGDDYDDLAVGAEGYSSSTGRVYIYHGASGGIGSSLSQSLDGENTNHYFGDALASNDSNLDGYDDLVVSATNYDGTYSNQGKVYLYTGSSTGIPTTSEQTWIGNYTENLEVFGQSTDF